jgi:hypothetical protein
MTPSAAAPRFAVSRCTPITPPVPGAEDITINLQTGRAFISCDNRRKWWRRPNGAIYAYDQ